MFFVVALLILIDNFKMSVSLDAKRIFLLAFENPQNVEFLKNAIHKTVSNATVFTANDGSEAMAKIENVPPNTIIIDRSLPKISGDKITETILKSKTLPNLSIILVGELPEQEIFLDDVVTGRLQFLANPGNAEELNHCLARALNYWSHSEQSEFFLRFLAPKDLLVRQGDAGDFVYIVRKGTLRAYTSVENKDVDLGLINAGEFVGEMSFITRAPRSANVIAETDCELIEIPINTFEKILYQKPGWSKALMVTLSNRVKVANQNRKV